MIKLTSIIISLIIISALNISYADTTNFNNETSPTNITKDSLNKIIDKNEYLGVVSMTSQVMDNSIIELKISASDFQKPVLGVSFYINYDSTNFSFIKYEPGDFLETGGDPLYLVTADKKDNKIIFGSTLNNDSSFPIGNGVITKMYFQKENDVADFKPKFSNGVISTLDVVRQDLDPILWESTETTSVFKPKSEVLIQKLKDSNNIEYATNKPKKSYSKFIIPPVITAFIIFLLAYLKKIKK